MSSVRQRRLNEDYRMVTELIAASGSTLSIKESRGSPPETYLLNYRCKGIERVECDTPVYRNEHRVCIELPAVYPAQQPVATMLTPIFHPHVFPTSVICLGRRWTPAEYLDSLILRIGAIIQYDPQYFDFSSPANRDAASWAQRHMRLFPVGRCSFREPLSASSGEMLWTNIK
jgi:ubiquitin-protein ligase